MNTSLKFFVILICQALCLSALAADQGSADEAISLVHKVVASMKANGVEKTVAEVNKGKFIDRDLYITITDASGVNVASSVNPKLVGKNLSEIRDANGKQFMKEGEAVVKEKGKGWIHFHWPNPVSKQIEAKSTYLEQFGELVISCGIYKKN